MGSNSPVSSYHLQYYHEQVCANCHMVPLESSICLFCGAIVCLKQHCCKTSEGCEAVRVRFFDFVFGFLEIKLIVDLLILAFSGVWRRNRHILGRNFDLYYRSSRTKGMLVGISILGRL